MSRKFHSFSDREKDTFNDLLRDYKLSPEQLAVIAAILFDALFVKSVLVDREQTIVVLLEGSLKRDSNNMEKLLNELRNYNVGEIMEFLSKKKK